MSEPAPRPTAWETVDPRVRDHVAALLATAQDGVLPVVQAGHPVLRRPAQPYTGQLGDLLPELLDVMRATMLAAPGVGLAAPQVGIGLRIAVLHDPGFPPGYEDAAAERERLPLAHRTIVNPRYEAVPTPGEGPDVERRSFYEGCLSVAGYQAVTARHRSVRLVAQDEHGRPVDEVLTGWTARIVQHETDHLDGTLYVDRAELRSLASNSTFASLWGGVATADVGRVLGFDVA
ncbi:peptide deformylase [Luteimicrobium subarcticum]|uniref:Peptide deformylase n=1 Tax=Luteimicrobium subarcticum TaxID=620910 RepID=A0A2M8WVG1_9MICO|nr:peptide deformylase [Luteimicrobium subarcticum]PJI94886.1 peptide deformylase [Luteimicrobium subarcticum]